MLGLGTYMYFKLQWDNATPPIAPMYSFIPVMCIFAFTITCTMGFLVVPWVMIGELYPQKVRGIIGGFTTCSAHIFVFLVVKTYPMMASALHEHGTFLTYGAVSLIGKYILHSSRQIFSAKHISTLLAGTVFFYFYLPETKGKTLQEIEEYFKGHTKTLDSKKTKLPTEGNFNNNITTANKTNAVLEKEKLLV